MQNVLSMSSERTIGLSIAGVLLAVIALASVAVQRGPELEQVVLEDLPTCSTCFDADPSEEACVEAGGTVRYRRSNECFNEPDVHDVCGLGVPCFTDGDGFYCRDVKDPYCHCETDDQCPDAYYCQFDQRYRGGQSEPILSTGQCQRIAPDSNEPSREVKTAPAL